MGRKTENRGGQPNGAKETSSYRTSRVDNEMREVIATFLIGHLRSEVPGMVSVTRAITAKDLRTARILVTVMDPTGETGKQGKELQNAAISALQENAYLIQEEVNRSLRMKYCPKLTFAYDEGFEQGMKVEMILKTLADKRTGENK